MAEACARFEIDLPDGARLDALAEVALMFPWPLGRERDERACQQIVYLADAVFAQLSRGWGALDIAIGEGLAALAVGHRAMRLSYSSFRDYAREELGINASTAEKMERLARGLRERPLLREAVRQGRISPRKAETILPVARGDAEAYWVQRAEMDTVRGLHAAASMPPDPEEDQWRWLCLEVPAGKGPVLEKALSVARGAVSPTAPLRELLLKMCEEFLGAHPGPDTVDLDEARVLASENLASLEEHLERESRKWASLTAAPPVEAPAESFEYDPWHLHVRLRKLVAQRNRWDEALGHLAMVFRGMRGWHVLGYASFAQYCRERLGMAERTVSQRASLERKLREVPVLREALREKRLSYEKARLLARHLEKQEIPAWIDRASNLTCVQLRRALEGKDEAQMCARGVFQTWLPRSTALVVLAAFHAARREAKRSLTPGECLIAVAEHFIEVWKPLIAQRNTVKVRVRKRDGHLCQVPGCSRPAVDTHHVVFRSHGGSDDESNLVGVCAAHHLRGIHDGLLRVCGKAPDELRWEVLGPDGYFIPLGQRPNGSHPPPAGSLVAGGLAPH